jgi:hypothetical protein
LSANSGIASATLGSVGNALFQGVDAHQLPLLVRFQWPMYHGPIEISISLAVIFSLAESGVELCEIA